MIRAADIREWRNRSVDDPKGHKIGVLEAVYVDTTTDEPAMATVRTGLPTRHHLFVALDEAILGSGYVKVSYPPVGLDDILPAVSEEAILQHYDMPHQTGAGGERQLARH